jgi:predicted nucleotidyltransferase
MFNPDFKEFIQSLNDNQVKYLIIGGYAVAYHGHPRYTKDMDIWLEMTSENADRILAALVDFGFGSLDLGPEDFMTPDRVIQLGYPPHRIDLITTPDGVDFQICYSAKVEVEIGGITVPFIDLFNLRLNKRASGRLQDLADLEKLED